MSERSERIVEHGRCLTAEQSALIGAGRSPEGVGGSDESSRAPMSERSERIVEHGRCLTAEQSALIGAGRSPEGVGGSDESSRAPMSDRSERIVEHGGLSDCRAVSVRWRPSFAEVVDGLHRLFVRQ